jgi:predicted acyl esterase
MTDMKFWRGEDPTGAGYPSSPNPRTVVDERRRMMIDYDSPVTMRDGVEIYVNVYRPLAEATYPSILVWTAYGKDSHYVGHAGGQDIVGLSEHTQFEAPDPVWWTRRGYAVVVADPRGAFNSEGERTFLTEQEARDMYDVIEWIARQPWSDGKIGMAGVSYLAWSQWWAASLNPPHLVAINPWEGTPLLYHNVAVHDGIPTDFFPVLVRYRWQYSRSGRVEDLVAMLEEHPFFDEYWESKVPRFERITVPTFAVASWSDHGLHTWGTLEAWAKAHSREKYLLIHGRKKWKTFYDLAWMQRQFFDRYLRGAENDVRYWPRVMYEVRDRNYIGNFYEADDWPVPGTRYVQLYLGDDGSLRRDPLGGEHEISYDPLGGGISFLHRFDADTKVVGHMKLRLWVSVRGEGADDADLFVAVDKLDRSGEVVEFPWNNYFDNGPVTRGWLRVSCSELDEGESTPYRPVHPCRGARKLAPGEIRPVDVALWPSGTLFREGEGLRLTIAGHDINVPDPDVETAVMRDIIDPTTWSLRILESPPFYKHSRTVNRGAHVAHVGGRFDSHLLVPIIP